MRERFIVNGNTCVVSLVTLKGECKAGLIINGASQMEEFCKAAIASYEAILKHQNKKENSERKK